MDIIALAAKALKPISERGISVQQGWYDKNVKKMHVTLWNLGDYEGGHSDDEAEVEAASVQVNIWSDRDQVELKAKIKKLMRKAGFYFMEGHDELETDTKIFNSAMRFMAAQEAKDEEND